MGARKDLDDFVRKLKSGTGVVASKNTMRLIGERCIQLIVRRTQKGLGVARTGGQEIPLRNLSDSYIEYRRKKARQLDPTTRPITSNLTFTGQMLRSMTVKQLSNSVVSVGPDRRRRKGGVTNEQIAEYLSKERPFNNLSANEIKTVVKFIDEILQLEIVKI